MKTLRLIAALLAPTLLAAGCPRRGGETKQPAQKEERKGALAADTDYASGSVQAALMVAQTSLDVAMSSDGEVSEEVKKAQENSVTTQTLAVSDNRGKLVFTTEDFYVPKGTELRYNPAVKKYVLADPSKKQYWAMSGSEVGSLLEGGPAASRSNYDIKITDTGEKETVAGFATVRTDALLSFDWTVKIKDVEKKGKVKVKLAIWHSADAKLKDSWGDMMIDFLTVPFQDEHGGQKVVTELKNKIKFPLKWIMEVDNEGQAKEKGDQLPKLVTTAQKVDIRDVPKPELATPPPGFEPAGSPYEFGQGGQTAKEDLLSKLPAKKGTPPDEKPQDK